MFVLSQLSQMLAANWPEAITFMLVLARAAGLIVGAPFWGSRMVPLPVRIWVSIVLAIATYPLVKITALPGGISLLSVSLALVGETFLGLVLGWMAQMIFAGMRLAGQAIETKSGLGFIQLVDPHEGGSTGIFSAFLEVLAGLVFFAMNGHHLLIQALVASYTVFPLAGDKFATRLLEGVVGSAGQIFAIGLRVSAPVVIGLLLSDIVLGILARAIPQMNIFMVAQPLQFGLAIFLLMLSLPALVWFFARQLPLMVGVPGGG
jgi:flagellar biosynthetic protein FliR